MNISATKLSSCLDLESSGACTKICAPHAKSKQNSSISPSTETWYARCCCDSLQRTVEQIVFEFEQLSFDERTSLYIYAQDCGLVLEAHMIDGTAARVCDNAGYEVSLHKYKGGQVDDVHLGYSETY